MKYRKCHRVLPGIDGVTDLGVTDPEDNCKDDWDELLEIIEALDDVSDYEEYMF